MLLSLLFLALAALPAVRAAPAGSLTHGGLALLHELEDDRTSSMPCPALAATHDGARRESRARVG